MMNIAIGGIFKIEKAEDSAKFSVAIDLNPGELYLSGWRLIKGRIWPPAYRAGRGQYFPILYASQDLRRIIYEAAAKTDWPEGITPPDEDFERATDLFKPSALTLAKLFPNV